MNNEPLVSVIVPAFNAAKTIAETISSALNQTYGNIEIVVIDDNSNDNTAEIMGEMCGRFKNIIYHKNATKTGPSASRNIGIASSSGNYIAFLDSDDLWLSGKIRRQVDYFLSYPDISLVFCKSKILRYQGMLDCPNVKFPKEIFVSQEKAYGRLLLSNFMNTSSVMVRKIIFKETGYFDENIFLAEDHDLWLRILKEGFRFGFIDEFLVIYRDNPAGTSKNPTKFESTKLDFLKKHLGNNPDLSNDYVKRCYSDAYLDIGLGYYKENDLRSSRKYLLKSIFYDKANLESYAVYFKTLFGVRILKILRIIKSKIAYEKFSSK